ncbi:MAG: hypothetical protein RI963_2062 [Planctomycetota bacterium]
MPRDEFGSVFEHVDEPVQFPQDIVGDMAGGAGFTVKEDRDIGILEADFGDELSQVQDRGYGGRTVTEFFIVDR